MRAITYIIGIVAAVCMIEGAKAQHAYFPTEGTILYDKTVHVKNLLRRHISTLKEDNFAIKYYEEMMGRVPETAVLKKKVSFRAREMSLESVRGTYDPLVSNLLQSGLLDYQQTLYQDFSTAALTFSFEIGGSPVFIQDSLLQVKWKITNEYRQIAGYDCRRANGVTLDSVYVVAFYTDQIPLSAGPGAVHGLPGMILGLVVPEQHFNIYATEVKFEAPSIKKVTAKKRDEPMTRRQAQARLKDVVGRWMSEQQLNLLFAAMFL